MENYNNWSIEKLEKELQQQGAACIQTGVVANPAIRKAYEQKLREQKQGFFTGKKLF